MPFDGQDYKALVKQITSGDYREPTKLSGKLHRVELLQCVPFVCCYKTSRKLITDPMLFKFMLVLNLLY